MSNSPLIDHPFSVAKKKKGWVPPNPFTDLPPVENFNKKNRDDEEIEKNKNSDEVGYDPQNNPQQDPNYAPDPEPQSDTDSNKNSELQKGNRKIYRAKPPLKKYSKNVEPIDWSVLENAQQAFISTMLVEQKKAFPFDYNAENQQLFAFIESFMIHFAKVKPTRVNTLTTGLMLYKFFLLKYGHNLRDHLEKDLIGNGRNSNADLMRFMQDFLGSLLK